jgi:CBS domain-containing protein
MRCEDLMKREVQTIREHDTIRTAAERMAAAHVGFLPVCDEGRRAIGTVTDRDIAIRAVAEGKTPDGCRVGDIMSRSVVACRPYDDVTLAERLMAQHQKSRIVVTDEDGVLRGVISLSDIAEHEPARRAARTLREVAAREAPRP